MSVCARALLTVRSPHNIFQKSVLWGHEPPPATGHRCGSQAPLCLSTITIFSLLIYGFLLFCAIFRDDVRDRLSARSTTAPSVSQRAPASSSSCFSYGSCSRVCVCVCAPLLPLCPSISQCLLMFARYLKIFVLCVIVR